MPMSKALLRKQQNVVRSKPTTRKPAKKTKSSAHLSLVDTGEGESDLSSSRIKAPAKPRSCYLLKDAIDFTAGLKGKGVAGIATSPPYNKAFNNRGGNCSNWASSKLMADNYTHFEDNMSDEDYISWQRKFIGTAMDSLGHDGVLLYNIGRKTKKLRQDMRAEIVKDFPVRQLVIWNRGSSNNQGGKRPSILPPIYEMIYIIAGDGWRLPERYLSEFRKWGDVWRIVFETGNPHPAPFPLELAVRMAKLIDGHLADPFAGSGTMGIAAMEIGVPYTLNDISPEYKKMFEARKKRYLVEKAKEPKALFADSDS